MAVETPAGHRRRQVSHGEALGAASTCVDVRSARAGGRRAQYPGPV